MNTAPDPRTRRGRALVRGLLLAVATGTWFAWFCIAAVVWPTSARRARLRDRAMHGWSRWVVRALGIRVVVDGALPPRTGLLVSNHVSYVDIPVLASIAPMSFLAKSEVATWPVLGFLARTVGVQFVVRSDKRGLPEAERRLHDEVQRGHAVAFFPEGTSSDGEAVLPFRPALLEQAAQQGLPVLHAAIRYTTPDGSPPARLSVAWWGDMTLLPHLSALLRLPSIEARVRFASEPVIASDRKELARALQEGVERDLAQLADDQGAGGRKSSASSRTQVRLSTSPRPRL